MNLLWRDDFGSFLDSSVTDAGGSPLFASTPLLWTGNGPSPSAAWDTSQDMLWAEPRSSAASFQLADNAGDPGVTGLGNGNLPLTAGSMPSDGGSLVWEATLFRLEKVSAIAHSSTLDSALNHVLDMVWTATGGTGSPPVTLPHAPTNPFLDGFPPFGLPPSQLVWTGQPSLNEFFPDGTGQPPFLTPTTTGNPPVNDVSGVGAPPLTSPAGEPPLTPPASGNLPVNVVDGFAGPTFSTAAAQHLVWIDPSTGAPTLFNDQSTAVLMPFPLASHP